MIESIYNFFSSIFNDNIILATILISMVPIIEIKGSIPFATSEIVWKDLAINNWQALGWSILGSSTIVIILALIFKPIISQMKKIKGIKKIGCAIEKLILSKSSDIDKKAGAGKFYYWKKILFVFIFVALPLPLTGVWTGTCIAVCLNIDYWTTCFTVIFGNIVAGLIIALIIEFIPWLNNWLLFIFLGMVAIILLIKLVIFLLKRKTSKQ